jgi:hypothetical protein
MERDGSAFWSLFTLIDFMKKVGGSGAAEAAKGRKNVAHRRKPWDTGQFVGFKPPERQKNEPR